MAVIPSPLPETIAASRKRVDNVAGDGDANGGRWKLRGPVSNL